MSLQSGRKLAHYEILELIGKGGMGEVFRAIDGKLGREVAIKVLPPELAGEQGRLRRFQREAKVLASLNHANVASIYGLEESDETHFLVLELVPGETLAEHIARGAISMRAALDIAKQIAEALVEAHERGIVHRDLKPANVKVTPDDKVKVLDFGLAKAFVDDAVEANASMSPTLTRDATRAGVILGTAAYMSPEQARGSTVDKRADIWAFGCVLYEMLTGRRAFPGTSVSDVLASVLAREPDWNALPASTPFLVERLVRNCLRKERAKRIPDIGVAMIDIEDSLASPSPRDHPAASPSRRLRPWVVAGVMAVSVAALAILWPSEADTRRPIRRFEIRPPNLHAQPQPAISPDGSRLVYRSQSPAGPSTLMVRRFDELDARPLAGTQGAYAPFFSPDSEWIGFMAGGELKKMPVEGGVPVTLCALPAVAGDFNLSWNARGDILSGGAESGLWRVSDAGGEPEILTRPDETLGDLDWHSPQFLPGDEAALFTLHDQNRGFRIEAYSFTTGERKVLIEDAFDGQFVPTGHVLYGREDLVLAVPFDSARLEITGPAVQMLENVDNLPISGVAGFTVGDDGTLVYLPAASLSARKLVWIDRDGTEEPLPLEPQAYSDPSVSSSGDRVAVAVRDGDGQDLWVYDVRNDTRRRVTFEGMNIMPVWTPDGSRLTFGSNRGGKSDIYWKSADGGGAAELLLSTGLWTAPESWAPNGETLSFTEQEATESPRAGMLRVPSDGSPERVLESYARSVTFSPNGRFIAYRSSGEVHVRTFPEMDSRWQVSTNGGDMPVWGRDGRELFYRRGNALIAVPVVTDPEFQYGPPRELFEREIASSLYYDGRARAARVEVAPDGRFLIATPSEDELQVRPLYVVENWFEELEARVPTNR